MAAMEKQPVRAVVLGGGGARGAYEVGVWQAMEELGMDYQVVTGTSVGALNGALMVQKDLDAALYLWNHLDNSDVMEDMPNLTEDKGSRREIYRSFFRQVIREGGVDTAPLARLVEQLVDEKLLRLSPRELGIVTVDVTARQAVELFLPEIPSGQLPDYLLASAACFPFFRPREIGGATFVDGGYANNIPVDLALRARQTPEEMIAVDVEGLGLVRRVHTHIPLKTIRCHWDLGDLFLFDRQRSRRNIRLGYLDTMKAMGRLEGQSYTFAPGQLEAMARRRLTGMSALLLTALDQALPEEGSQLLGRLTAGRLLSATGENEDQQPADILLTSAQLAGELLGLDPLPVYCWEEFEAKVLELRGQATLPGGNSLSLDSGPARLKQVLEGQGREQLLLTVEALLRRGLGGEGNPLPWLAAAFPREYLAALYLILLTGEEGADSFGR